MYMYSYTRRYHTRDNMPHFLSFIQEVYQNTAIRMLTFSLSNNLKVCFHIVILFAIYMGIVRVDVLDANKKYIATTTFKVLFFTDTALQFSTGFFQAFLKEKDMRHLGNVLRKAHIEDKLLVRNSPERLHPSSWIQAKPKCAIGQKILFTRPIP